MNFAACDGDIVSVLVDGYSTPACSGTLSAFTAQDIASTSTLSPEDSKSLMDATIVLFTVVFGFLVLRKLL